METSRFRHIANKWKFWQIFRDAIKKEEPIVLIVTHQATTPADLKPYMGLLAQEAYNIDINYEVIPKIFAKLEGVFHFEDIVVPLEDLLKPDRNNVHPMSADNKRRMHAAQEKRGQLTLEKILLNGPGQWSDVTNQDYESAGEGISA